MKNIKNKNGMEVLSNLFGYFLLVLITIIFWIIAYHVKLDFLNNIAKEVAIDNSRTDFLLFLREPVNYNNERIDISELIIQSEYDKQKSKILKEKINEHFNKNFNTFWNLDITYQNHKDEFGHSYKTQQIGTWSTWFIQQLDIGKPKGFSLLPVDKKITVKITLPGFDEKDIEINFENWLLFNM